MHEHPLPPSGDGSVLLDIGGDVGALVLHVLPELDGQEIDLFRAGTSTPLMHSAVRRRDVLGGSLYAAVYPSVPAGDYLLEGSSQPVRVDGGLVTELHYAPDSHEEHAHHDLSAGHDHDHSAGHDHDHSGGHHHDHSGGHHHASSDAGVLEASGGPLLSAPAGA
jgi:hypothetical protein